MRKMWLLLLGVCVLGFGGSALAADWESLTKILDVAIANRVFPGCTAAVFTKDKQLYSVARGSFTYGVPPPHNPGRNPPMERTTLFDLASCTKVVAGTAAAALLYQRGLLDLDAKVSHYVPGFEAGGKGGVTVRQLLEHNAGFPPDPAPEFATAAFGCPETGKQHPRLTFSCRDRCHAAVLATKLEHAPGSVYVYSDVGLMAMMAVVGRIAHGNGLVTEADVRADCPLTGEASQCFFEAFCRKYIFSPLGMSSTMYLPPTELKKSCAPSHNDTEYRHTVVQGDVQDTNAYAQGGISGHAGLFSTVDDLVVFLRAWLFPTPELSAAFLNATTISTFIKQQNHTLSSRAIGWNTNTPDAPDHGWEFSCGTLSPTTFLHIG